jgi:hypothetical protein
MCFNSPDYPCPCSADDDRCNGEPFCEVCGSLDPASLADVYDPDSDTTVKVCVRCLP